MKVLHVPYGFYPDPAGGTEVYVEALARELLRRGVQVAIAAPGNREEAYIHKEISVRRYAVSDTLGNLTELYGGGDSRSAEQFAGILEKEKPDIVHLHAFTRGVSLLIIEEAKKRKAKVVFTYHTPAISCQRGTLMRWGKEACDGKLDAGLCTRCALHGKGVPLWAAVGLGSVPALLGDAAGRGGLSGGFWTGFRMRHLVGLAHEAVRRLLRESDHVVAVSGWVKALLILNGVPESKILLSRQGLTQTEISDTSVQSSSAGSNAGGKLRIAFFGRLQSAKGLPVLIKALRQSPQMPVFLDVYGILQEGEESYAGGLREMAGSDRRIRFLEPISPELLVQQLRSYDLLAVPSTGLETGPLVVLEAFAAGVPVIGSRLGGIAELVRDGVDGILVEAGSERAWNEKLEEICRNPEILRLLKGNIQPPRRMRAVADEMKELYEKLMGGNAGVALPDRSGMR